MFCDISPVMILNEGRTSGVVVNLKDFPSVTDARARFVQMEPEGTKDYIFFMSSLHRRKHERVGSLQGERS